MSETISSGTVSGLNVSGAGDVVTVIGSGALVGATISSGGTVNVSAGGIDNAEIVGNNGYVNVLSGGTESGGTLALFGTEHVSAGGTAIDTTLVAQAFMFVYSGGVISSAFADAAFANIDVSSGGIMSGGTDANGGVDLVYSGGVAIGEVISSGGLERIRGGMASGTTILSGGLQTVESGGAAMATAVSSGGTQIIASGIAKADIVTAGGLVTVLSGGTESGGTLALFGTENVSSGGTAIGTKLVAQATLSVSSGGVGSGIIASAVFADVNAFSGGVLSGGTDVSGAADLIYSGGAAFNQVVGSAGLELVVGGSVQGTSVLSGGTQVLFSGSNISATIALGGTQIVSNGVTVDDSINGLQVLSSGGEAVNDSIGSGGTQIISSGATAVGDDVSLSGALLGAGGIGLVDVMSGGTESGGTYALQSQETVYAGGTALGDTLIAQAKVVISSGGFASGIMVDALFANVDVSSGGLQINGSDANYGTDYIYAGGTTLNETVSATGIEQLVGGATSGTLILSGGIQIVSSGVALNDTVFTGGLQTVSSGGTEIGTTLSGGTDFLSAGAVASGAVTFVGSGGDLEIGSGGSFTAPISGFVSGGVYLENRLNLQGFGIGTIVTATAPNTVTATSGGSSLTFDIVGAFTGESFTVVSDPNGGVDIVPCFLEGTHVLTESGEKRIEEVAVGDLVITRGAGGTPASQPVTWIGKRSLRAADLPEGERHPVRIRIGAFGNGLPHRDLLITQEHCVFVDGKLVPARMLINGRSIVSDRTISAYTIYHLELAQHAVLFAEGLTTESYLDTGNRTNFANAETVALRPNFSLNEQSPEWANAAAPLAVDRKFVESIWVELEQRAMKLGFARTTPAPTLTKEPDLHLVLDGSLRVEALAVHGNRHQFVIPPNTSTVRLASRAGRPSDVVGPFVDDRRQLGVMVGEIVGHIGKHRHAETAHLSRVAVPGWFAIEGSRARWTDGNALLPIDLSTAKHKPMLLEIEIIHCGPYQVEEPAISGVIAIG